MTLKKGITTLALALLLISPSSFAALSDYSGVWENTDASTRGITKIVVRTMGGSVRVHTWGQCHPQDCDWGMVEGTAYTGSVNDPVQTGTRVIMAEYEKNFAVTTLLLQAKGDRMRVESYTKFRDGSKRSNYTESYSMQKTRGGPRGRDDSDMGQDDDRMGRDDSGSSGEDCIAFETNRARVQRINGRWKITVGSMYLLDFDTKRAEAEQALRIIRGLGMNQQCFVGRPNPSFEYYLSGNAAPHGNAVKEDCVDFNPNAIRVRRINNSWKIVEGSHWLFDFGGKVNEARDAYRIIKKYRFSQSCFVGRPGPSMRYLKRR